MVVVNWAIEVCDVRCKR